MTSKYASARLPLVLLVLLSLTACERAAHEGSRTATPRALAVRSALDYADNERGLIVTARLEQWLDDWAGARPRAITGDLVILQLDAAGDEAPYLRERPGVRVYHAPELAALVKTRNNGAVAIGSVPAGGLRIDSFLRHFDIDPLRDFVLFVRGTASAPNLVTLARAFLTFRYWGVSQDALGLLNGAVQDDLALDRRTTFVAAHPFTGTRRVSELEDENFVLLADLLAVRAAIGTETLVDVRDEASFLGETRAASVFDATCLAGLPHCTPTFSGRIHGAVHLPFSALVTDDGRLRDRAAIEAALDEAGIDGTRVAYVYDLDGRESAVATFALLTVAGRPARWYAASFLEWGALNASHPDPALRTLPETSPLRTDHFGVLTEGTSTWAGATEAVRPLVYDAAPASTDRVQQSDRAYRSKPPELPAPNLGEGGC